jgi:hypothetical protein
MIRSLDCVVVSDRVCVRPLLKFTVAEPSNAVLLLPPLGGGLLAARLSKTPGGNPSMGDDCADADEHTPKAIEARAISKRKSLRTFAIPRWVIRFAFDQPGAGCGSLKRRGFRRCRPFLALPTFPL